MSLKAYLSYKPKHLPLLSLNIGANPLKWYVSDFSDFILMWRGNFPVLKEKEKLILHDGGDISKEIRMVDTGVKNY